ncbi:MAG: cytochrome b/b6 domain-containing protein [Gemmatimonadales bacterium]
MDLWRTATNPWGQEVLVGISWDLLWAAVVAGVAFMLAHWAYVRLWASREIRSAPVAEPGPVPERVLRHTLASRLFHWLMAAAMFGLLITAFFPVIGIRFPWVTIHWIAGLVLLATVIYHVIHSTMWHDFWAMWVGREELREGVAQLRRFLGRSVGSKPRAGKYPLDHKLYHHVVALVSVLAILTGLLMMFRVDTPFWARNPYLLSDGAWGVVYVVHGLSGVALITLVIAHVYFALRPEKWWITLSMINGWIGRSEYLAHHDPERWKVSPETSRSRVAAPAEEQPVA